MVLELLLLRAAEVHKSGSTVLLGKIQILKCDLKLSLTGSNAIMPFQHNR